MSDMKPLSEAKWQVNINQDYGGEWYWDVITCDNVGILEGGNQIGFEIDQRECFKTKDDALNNWKAFADTNSFAKYSIEYYPVPTEQINNQISLL